MLRPEQLRLTEAGRPGALAGEVAATRFGGAVSWVVVRVEGAELEVQVTGDRPAIGERVAVERAADAPPAPFFARPA